MSMTDDSPEQRRARLEWEFEKLARRGWSSEEMQAVLKSRTNKPRGRRPTPDDEHIARIKARDRDSRRSAVRKISDEISDKHRLLDSIVDRLRKKSTKAEQRDRYRAQIKEFTDLILVLPPADRDVYADRLGHQARLDLTDELMRQLTTASEDLDRAKFHLIEARKAGSKRPPTEGTFSLLEQVLRELRSKVGR
jgi:hypothetical protein